MECISIKGYHLVAKHDVTTAVIADDIGQFMWRMRGIPLINWTATRAWYLADGQNVVLATSRVPGDLEVMREDFARREAERLQAGQS